MQHYYAFVTDHLQRPGIACVSTPTAPRNKCAATDFLDAAATAYERNTLAPAAADDKFVVNPQALCMRGYSLWRVLRRMEMENVDTANLMWLAYAMHVESRQASLAMATRNAPLTSILAPTHSPTILSSVRLDAALALVLPLLPCCSVKFP